MITIKGTVQNGAVRLPETIRGLEGAHVIVTILDPIVKGNGNVLSEAIETEDVEFVRACRGRLAKQTKLKLAGHRVYQKSGIVSLEYAVK